MQDNKKIVWILFDNKELSYKKTYEKYFNKIFEVHSIGINNIKFPKSENYFYHQLNLSLTNNEMFSELNKLPKPDVIMASPPSKSWFISKDSIDIIRSFSQETEWTVINKKLYDDWINNNERYIFKKTFFTKERERINGEATVGATTEIINYFKPKVWVIENPKNSKLWEFQKNHWDFDGIENVTFYNVYDKNLSSEPITFKSNIKLKFQEHINKTNPLQPDNFKKNLIPEKLIKNIIDNILYLDV